MGFTFNLESQTNSSSIPQYHIRSTPDEEIIAGCKRKQQDGIDNQESRESPIVATNVDFTIDVAYREQSLQGNYYQEKLPGDLSSVESLLHTNLIELDLYTIDNDATFGDRLHISSDFSNYHLSNSGFEFAKGTSDHETQLLNEVLSSGNTTKSSKAKNDASPLHCKENKNRDVLFTAQYKTSEKQRPPRKNLTLFELRQRNREHAKKSRMRKKSHTQVLQQSASELKLENERIRKQIYKILGKEKGEAIIASTQQRNEFLAALKRPRNRILSEGVIRHIKNQSYFAFSSSSFP